MESQENGSNGIACPLVTQTKGIFVVRSICSIISCTLERSFSSRNVELFQ
jgi:hypothetical protein